jgi:hypothetical protein
MNVCYQKDSLWACPEKEKTLSMQSTRIVFFAVAAKRQQLLSTARPGLCSKNAIGPKDLNSQPVPIAIMAQQTVT